jgi:hypothetical protein
MWFAGWAQLIGTAQQPSRRSGGPMMAAVGRATVPRRDVPHQERDRNIDALLVSSPFFGLAHLPILMPRCSARKIIAIEGTVAGACLS